MLLQHYSLKRGVISNTSTWGAINDLPALIRQGLSIMFLFVSKRQASECLNLSSSTLKKYRLEGDWIEGIHWVRINSRCVRYNLELIQDWLHNRHDPATHLKAIEAYQANLLSNQRKSTRK